MWSLKLSPLLRIILLFSCNITICLAAVAQDNSSIGQRTEQEETILPNSFGIAFYKPTYILPFYYTGSPDNNVYQNSTPGKEHLKHMEVKYQLSFKVPVWKNAFNHPTTFYLAYSQIAYWQAYNKTAFFRETDYEPEIFVANKINLYLYKNLHVNFLNVGAAHQSNGYGGTLERGWDRIYLEAITSTNHWMVSIKPWYIIHDNIFNQHNPNIGDYLGYGQLTVAYKYARQVFAIQVHSLVENGGKRATAELTWSFPVRPYLHGYVDVFSGYGQSLIEYNHHTTSTGVGIALSNWI